MSVERVLGAAGILCIGWLARYVTEPVRWTNDPEIIVAEHVIREAQPPADPTWRDRVVNRYIGPTQLATAPGAAAPDVDRFCKPLLVSSVDTVEVVAEEILVLESVDTGWSWWFGKTPIEFVGFTNFGDLKRMRYEARPMWDARAVGDSLLVRYPRLAFPAQVALFGIPLGIGYVLGQIF